MFGKNSGKRARLAMSLPWAWMDWIWYLVKVQSRIRSLFYCHGFLQVVPGASTDLNENEARRTKRECRLGLCCRLRAGILVCYRLQSVVPTLDIPRVGISRACQGFIHALRRAQAGSRPARVGEGLLPPAEAGGNERCRLKAGKSLRHPSRQSVKVELE